MKNKILTKKFSAVLIIIVMISMIAVIFSSCDETDDNTQTITTKQVSAQEKTGGETDILSAEKTQEAQRILPDLPEYPDEHWTKYNLKILTQKSAYAAKMNGVMIPSDGQWIPRDISAEEETGEPINDAVYHRNATLEAKYNFTVEQIFTDNLSDTLQKAVAAGDKYFDVVSTTGAAYFAQQGYFVDLFDIYYLDFEKPWWDKDAVSAMSIGKRLFFVTGDFGLINKDATSAMLFNKELLADLELESPYELVRSNRWTVSKLSEMARVAAADLDGNSRMDWEIDRFGYINRIVSLSMVHAFGERYAGKDENDLPVLNIGSERMYSAFDVILGLKNAGFSGNKPYGFLGEAGLSSGESMFTEKRGLFLEGYINSVEKLRGMEMDFGILPMPKFDEHQPEWGHSADSFYAQTLSVPNFFDSVALDRIGFMLEAISAESRYTVTPAYYDIQLQGKFARDEESHEMLDIIFSSMIWDTGLIYGWFGNAEGYMSASGIESRRGVIEAAMQKTIDDFANLD